MSHSVIIIDKGGSEYIFFPPHDGDGFAATAETHPTVAKIDFRHKKPQIVFLTAKQSAAASKKSYATSISDKTQAKLAQLFEGVMPS